MKNLLITGATGMLGREVYKAFNDLKSYQIYTVSRNECKDFTNHFILDITKEDELFSLLKRVSPEVVIHCAAIVNVGYCEKYPQEAENLHVISSRNLASYSSVDQMVYISTDSVFDGKKGNYREDDETNPLNAYAASKRKGELAVLTTAKRSYIIRTNIVGFNSHLNNSLFEWAYKEISSGNHINGFSNVKFNPLYTGTLAKLLKSFLDKQLDSGYYNFGSKSSTSKYHFLVKIAQAMEIDTTLISSVKLDIAQFEAIRPLDTTLNIDKLCGLGLPVPDIDECIEALINDFKNEK